MAHETAGDEAEESVEESVEDVVDSPTGWVAKHIRRYVETGGEKGHDFQGVPTLLLTTRGRKSGVLRRTALIYGTDGDRYVVVASNGGAADHPGWYRNLAADPEVRLQVRAETFTGRARTATVGEKPALWRRMAEIFPTYDSYQKKTDREIPVVVIERAPGASSG